MKGSLRSSSFSFNVTFRSNQNYQATIVLQNSSFKFSEDPNPESAVTETQQNIMTPPPLPLNNTSAKKISHAFLMAISYKKLHGLGHAFQFR